MKYKISKLDVNAYSGYEKEVEFKTAKEMFAGIKNMENSDNGWFHGKGSVVSIDGDVVATLHDYECYMMPEVDPYTGRKVVPTPSIKGLLEYVESVNGE